MEDKKQYENRSKALVLVGLWIVLLVFPVAIYKSRFPGVFISRGAMDEAQIARNLARGAGFTTNYIRPQMHSYLPNLIRPPDLTNSPLHVWLLAYLPGVGGDDIQETLDVTITSLSICFYFLTALLLLYVGRKTCDEKTAFLAAIVYLFSLPVLQSVVGGSKDTFAAFIVTAYFLLVYLNKNESLILSLVLGAFLGLCYLTAYALLIMAIPLIVHILRSDYPTRYRHLAAVIVGLVVVTAPWMVRNLSCGGNAISGQPFASLLLSSPAVVVKEANGPMAKFMPQLADFYNSLIHSSGSVVLAFFLISPLVRLENPQLQKTKAIFWTSLVLVIFPSLLGSGQPVLLPAFLPIAILFGTKTFMELIVDRTAGKEKLAKRLVGIFVVLNLLPFVVAVLFRGGGGTDLERVREARLGNISDMRDLMRPNEIVMTNAPECLSYYGDFLTVPLPKNESEFISCQESFRKFRYAAVLPYGSDSVIRRMVVERKQMPEWFVSKQAYSYPQGEIFLLIDEETDAGDR